MIAWENRPVEIANLLNPAFCSILIRDAAEAYSAATGHGMDFALVFVFLPLVLHKDTREKLPTSATSFHIWIQREQSIRIDFPNRTQSLVSLSKEALLFGLQRQILAFDDGRIVASSYAFQSVKSSQFSPETKRCRTKAAFVGKWLGGAGSTALIMSSLGITL